MRRRDHPNRRRGLSTTVMCAVALGACGGGADTSADEAKVGQVVKEAFTSTNKSACTRLATQAFLEQSELSKGREAVSSCEENAADNAADAVAVTSVEIDGDGAAARLRLDGHPDGYRDAAVQLKRSGASWKLDKLTDISIDRATFLAAGRRELRSPPDAAPASVADCVVEGYGAYSDREIERAIVTSNVAILAGPIFPCSAEEELKKAIPLVTAKCVARGLKRGQRSGRLARLLGRAKTVEDLDQSAFQRELGRLVRICARRAAPAGTSA